MDSLRDSFRIIQSVNGNDQFLLANLGSEILDNVLSFSTFCLLCKFIIVNSHRERIHIDDSIFSLDIAAFARHPGDSADRTQEVTHVIVGVKTYQISSTNPFKNFLPPWDHPDNFIRRERNMLEECDGRIR